MGTNYHKVETCNMTNGVGMRTVIWLSGCEHHCKACFNPQTWHPKSGKPFTLNTLKEVSEGLKDPFCDGLTLLGGEPLAEYNLSVSMELAKVAKDLGKTVWCYTGHRFEKVKHLAIMKYVDVLVDGRFVVQQYNTNLKWRGSANQRIIDVQSSLSIDGVVLHSEHNEVSEYHPERAVDPCEGMTQEEIKHTYIDNIYNGEL